MICLAHVNFWLALEKDNHVHHASAMVWLQDTPEEDPAFCRITQNGFLRLPTNPHVMKTDVLTSSGRLACLRHAVREPSCPLRR
jgi:hypothetical protein